MSTISTKSVVPVVGMPPEKATEGSAAFDLRYTPSSHDESIAGRTLVPMERTLLPTGISIALPEGTAALVLPRSGLAIKKGLTLINSPGLIDSDYRGEINVPIINLSANRQHIKAGDRIAQLLVLNVADVEFEETDELDETERGSGGFGSTGE